MRSDWMILVLLTVSALALTASAEMPTAEPLGEPVLERPTLHSLGAYWIIRGDDNRNAAVALEYRPAGGAWRKGMPLFRVEKKAHLIHLPEHLVPRGEKEQEQRLHSTVNVPDDSWLFAGSALLLEPGREYELKLTLSDPDGGQMEKVLKARTKSEPVAPADARLLHVVPPFPDDKSGSGSKDDPFNGLAAANEAAAPGDIILVHTGTYPPVELTKSGREGKPIIWRGSGDGEAIIDGAAAEGGKRAGRGIAATGLHDVWFENLVIRNVDYGIVIHDSARIVIRHCRISDVAYGITATRNTNDTVFDLFITDNIMTGPSTWPRSKGIEGARGVQVTGAGHVVAYNRITGFADAIDTFPSIRCAGIDFHNNHISEMTDDGIEMDYSERNTRCFHNHLTNIYQGITTQPVYGGPVYIFRNSMYNVAKSTFKMHNNPSGVLQMHNTSVKHGTPLILHPGPPVRNSISRNNLFVGTTGPYAFDCTAMMPGCDFDYDAFAGGPFTNFIKWDKVKYATAEEVRKKAPVYRHIMHFPSADLFASGLTPPENSDKQFPATVDLRLKPDAPAIDAALLIPGLNDEFNGKAPDLGAYEQGAPVPHYGPRATGDK